LRLTKLGILVLFTVLVYLVWSDLISATSYLDSVTLWEYNAGSSDNPQLAAMSAADVLGALVIVVFTVTLARNLPGLLEILILSRIDLRQGSSYAITTLLSYTIVSIGIISGLSALGVSWNKLQWLVAALGVGLGFGLQEIFANFVSGLIILFERPVRIGDVVTIGDLSGTVNRIRIRATTITDFDRKEIIVPNKTFVTEQLINWSLNDTVTRIIIRVGVAYGSDLAKVRELLLDIATNNSRVLKEPEPMVLFLNFGNSTLDHELRVHVRELMDRNQAIDEINREIDRQFREHDIEIAFRQIDLNLRNSEGLEQLVKRLQPKGDTGSDKGDKD
jgi:potassium efflux system protein